MLRLLLAFIISCTFALESKAQQNLVPNSSFEEYDFCPNNVNDIGTVCLYWSSFRVTADYYNACSSSFQNSFNNNFGFQQPRTGDAYAGFLRFEQLGAELLYPLEIGVKYYVNFYVSCAYRYNGVNIATNKIGARFTTYQYNHPNGNEPLPNTSQVYNNEIVTDTANWVKISGSFVADSAYRYIVIGRFFDDIYIDTIHLLPAQNWTHSYYYLDDVCVSTDASLCGVSVDDCNFILPTAFSPNGDNVNDEYMWVKNCSIVNEFAMRIYNRWGQLVFTTNDYNAGWDGYYNGKPQPTDVYAVYVSVISDNKQINKSTSITLLR